MIINRLSALIHRQDWSSLTIEMIVLVLGIFAGLQVNNWNEDRLEAKRLDRQLVSLAEEMKENLKRLDAYQDQLTGIIEDMERFRRLFLENPVEVSADELNRMLWRSIPIPTYQAKRFVLDAVLTSENFSARQVGQLAGLLQAWDELQRRLARVDQDALVYRDEHIHGIYTRRIAFSSIERYMEPPAQGLPASPFGNRPEEILADRVIENIATVRLTMTLGNLEYVEDLRDKTAEIVAFIENPPR